MARKKRPGSPSRPSQTPLDRIQPDHAGNGGETHQAAASLRQTLTTNQGIPVSDNQNSLKAGPRGPVVMDDFVFREKVMHFDHERIPERVVHARGSGAHGYFQPYKSFSQYSKAAFLQDPGVQTPVFVRFSTVIGNKGSFDLARDVRGFAVKFYTQEGIFDLVGNNIPVFFIQDGIKFPDLIHAAKQEPDRGFPQAQTAHDTFWDFISLTPESMHMVMWVMSDRAIPRSFRMMEGFGVNTFKLVNDRGEFHFVKFHWRPLLGSAFVLWDEAVKINGADPDFHRRDLWDAIDGGSYPAYELSVQMLSEAQAAQLEFDILDPTKIIPEEEHPLIPLGRMTLTRNPDNFFAEVEQVAYHIGNIVPGIDFSDDPLLQGRLFSYLDTQLKRLGGPNFHELAINRPRSLAQNYQRDGHMRMQVPRGRVSYEPNSLDPAGPRENPATGFQSDPLAEVGMKTRARPDTFSDHYSQARMFFRSMTPPEQNHIVLALGFELGKVETVAIRKRMLGHLMIIERELGERVEEALGMRGQADVLQPVRDPIDLAESPSLSMIRKAPQTLAGRKVGVLVSEGSDAQLLIDIRAELMKVQCHTEIVAPEVGGFTSHRGDRIPADMALAGAPSVLFDAVIVAISAESVALLEENPAAEAWVRDAFTHGKIIGFTRESQWLLELARVELDEGLVSLDERRGIREFILQASKHRIWPRAEKFRNPNHAVVRASGNGNGNGNGRRQH